MRLSNRRRTGPWAALPRRARPWAALSRLVGRAGFAALLLSGLLPLAAFAREAVRFEASAGVADASAAARIWAPDAFLVYLENDEDVGTGGTAGRWGYLYYSPTLKKARAYSVRDGRIIVAEDLAMAFEAPPVSTQWIDSGAALAAAEESAGRAFCHDQGGRLETMLLSRGAFHDGDPDQTTWTVIYSAPHSPSLFVVVDAAQGKVRRTWRG